MLQISKKMLQEIYDILGEATLSPKALSFAEKLDTKVKIREMREKIEDNYPQIKK